MKRKNTRNHTKGIASIVMNAPNMAVNPQIKTINEDVIDS